MNNFSYLDGTESGDDPVHRRLTKRIKVLVRAAQEVGLEKVAAVPVVLELALIQLHTQVRRLEVERDHLAARIPENLRHIVGRVDTAAFWVDTRHLPSVIVNELDSILAHLAQSYIFVERRHVVEGVL